MSTPVTSPVDRATIENVADLLFPRSARLPSASDVNLADKPIDEAMAARPDLRDQFIKAVAWARTLQPGTVAELAEADSEQAEALYRLIAAAYLTHREVKDALRYVGQRPTPFTAAEVTSYLADGILEPVTARGPIFVQPPR